MAQWSHSEVVSCSTREDDDDEPNGARASMQYNPEIACSAIRVSCHCAYSQISRWDNQVSMETMLKTNVVENGEGHGYGRGDWTYSHSDLASIHRDADLGSCVTGLQAEETWTDSRITDERRERGPRKALQTNPSKDLYTVTSWSWALVNCTVVSSIARDTREWMGESVS